MSPPAADPPLFHIGYVKTATTFLQRNVFSQARFGLALAGGPESRAHLVAALVLADGFISNPETIATELNKQAAPQRDAGLTPVWSEEVLLGDPLAHRYDGHSIAAQLTAAFPKARILITIREQKSMVLSMYREYAKQGGRADLRDFIGTGQEPLSFSPILRDHFLQFHRAVAFYQTAYGAENVCVLPQEMLVRDPAQYFKRLGGFLGQSLGDMPPLTRDNSGLSLPATRLNMFLNRFVVLSPLSSPRSRAWRMKARIVRLVDRLIPASVGSNLETKYRDKIAQRYQDSFTDGNRALAQMTGLPLEEYGYF